MQIHESAESFEMGSSLTKAASPSEHFVAQSKISSNPANG
jgi:hypothetical protein